MIFVVPTTGVGVAVFTAVQTFDVRFPTAREVDGSDAMNPEPDYSAAYLVVHTDTRDGLEGHGFAFTTGRGNDIEVAAIRALEPWIVGRDVAIRWPSWALSAVSSPATRSCAGSVRGRASSTWPSARAGTAG
jgi:hypothetical protein